MRSTWLILFFSCLAHVAFAQELFLDADKSSIKYGEVVSATLQIKASAQDKAKGLRLVDSIGPAISPLELIQPVSVDTMATETESGFEFLYTVAMKMSGFDSGRFELGPIPVLQGTDTLYSNSIFIQVSSVALDTSAAPKPIKENRQVPLTFLDYVAAYYPYPVSFVILCVLGYFLWKRWKKRKAQQAEKEETWVEEKPVIPAHIVALKALEQLKKDKAWEKLDDKAFYSTITDITRTYIGERYGIHAMEKTSQELVFSLQYKMQPRSLINDLQETLNVADMAKFAKEKPGLEFAKESLDKAIELVNKTAEKEMPNA